MDNQSASLKPFSIWAKETQAKHPDIIENWLNGSDPYRRAIAKTILSAGETSNF